MFSCYLFGLFFKFPQQQLCRLITVCDSIDSLIIQVACYRKNNLQLALPGLEHAVPVLASMLLHGSMLLEYVQYAAIPGILQYCNSIPGNNSMLALLLYRYSSTYSSTGRMLLNQYR